MNLLQRAVRRFSPALPYADGLHSFQGNDYWSMPVMSAWNPSEERVSSDFASLVGTAFKSNAIVFACELTRISLFSEARFQWRQLRNGRPGDLFGTKDLSLLERPWPGGTTGDLLGRMLLDADFGTTAFVVRPNETPDRLMRLRPDWVTIILGSQQEPEEARIAADVEFLGVLYHPGGVSTGRDPVLYLADEVACWSPIPDPLGQFSGTSWLTPVLAEIQADIAATTHKLMFFKNGATPQVIVTVGEGVQKDQFESWVTKQNALHNGVLNAYKTLYLKNVDKVDVVGKDLAQLDFKATQGAGETRIAAASGVHPVVAALSEGMAGSSLNAGNFNSAKRLVADRTLRPLWRSVCAALEAIVPAPDGAQLWFDERDISFLQEDRKDAAEIQQTKALTIEALVRAGYDPKSVQAAVEAEDMNLLAHTGLYSVQLQPPGTEQATDGAAAPPQLPAGDREGKNPARPRSIRLSGHRRAFNPTQPRDRDGEWSDGIPGPAADRLGLAGRIRLGDGERFGGSDRVSDNEGNALVMARVDGPRGTVVRVGMVDVEDTRAWRAENKGRTVELELAAAIQLRGAINAAATAGKQNVSDYRASLRAAHKANLPDDQWPAPEADVASGVIPGGRWGDIHWKVTREEGEDYVVGGEELGPGGKWFVAIDPAAEGSDPNTREPFYLSSPAEVRRLDKALEKLVTTAGGPS